MQNGTYFNKFLEHFRNTRRLFKSIERWLFLEEKATYRSGKLILSSCYPTLATKTKTWRGWGTQRLLVFNCRSNRALSAGVYPVAMDVSGLPPFCAKNAQRMSTRHLSVL